MTDRATWARGCVCVVESTTGSTGAYGYRHAGGACTARRGRRVSRTGDLISAKTATALADHDLTLAAALARLGFGAGRALSWYTHISPLYKVESLSSTLLYSTLPREINFELFDDDLYIKKTCRPSIEPIFSRICVSDDEHS